MTPPVPAADATDAVPAGWKLVPIEPTPEMLLAGNDGIDDDIDSWNYDSDWGYSVEPQAAFNVWERMLAASPPAPVPVGGEVVEAGLTEEAVARAILRDEYGSEPEDVPDLYGRALSTARLVMALVQPAIEAARREERERCALAAENEPAPDERQGAWYVGGFKTARRQIAAALRALKEGPADG